MTIHSKIGLLFLMASLSVDSMAQAGIMLSVSLENPTQIGDVFGFDVKASLTGGTVDDYVNSITLGLDMSSIELLSPNPNPFLLEFAAGWDGGVDPVSYLLQFDVIAFPPDVPIFNDSSRIIGTLYVDSASLPDGQYTVSLNSNISLALGSDANDDIFVVDTIGITAGSAKFVVQGQTLTVPEPASCWIFCMMAGVGLFCTRICGNRSRAG